MKTKFFRSSLFYELSFILIWGITGVGIIYYILASTITALFPELTAYEYIIRKITDIELIKLMFWAGASQVFLLIIKRYQAQIDHQPISFSGRETIILILADGCISKFISSSLFKHNIIISQLVFIGLVIGGYFFLKKIISELIVFRPVETRDLIKRNWLRLKRLRKQLSYENIKNKIRFFIDTGRKEKRAILVYLTKKIAMAILYLIKLSMIIILVAGCSFWLIKRYYRYLSYRDNLRKQFIITNVKPKTSTQGDKVTINGYNFKFRWNPLFKVNSSAGEINDINLWDETKIIFTVPLHVQPGELTVWLQRTAGEASESARLTSNQVKLKIEPREKYYPVAQDYQYPPSIFSWLKKYIKSVKRKIYFR